MRRIREHFCELDTNEWGLVTKEALRLFQGLTLDPPRALTAAFLHQLFQEIPTERREGETVINFRAFIELTLAFEFIQSPRSLRYLWRCVDVQKQGFIDRFTVTFPRTLHWKYVSNKII